MPTGSNPIPPANPYAEGNINPGSNKESKTSQIVEATIPISTSTEATTITSALRENASIESTPTANHTQKPEKNNIPVEEKSDPQNSDEKKTDFYNFFSDSPNKNILLFYLAVAISALIIGFLFIEYDISSKHLSESHRLLEKNHELSNEDTKEINSFRNHFSLYGFLLALFFIALSSCFAKIIMKILDKYPQRLFIFIMILGGVSAFFVPQFLYSFKYIGETKDITTALLTVTGGVLAIFTLLKTHQKNILDKETLDFERKKYAESVEDRKQDIAKQEELRKEQKSQFNMTLALQKNKDFQEHIRQVHAERRVRYAKAIEQFGHTNVTVRLGGINTLIGLANEWASGNEWASSDKDNPNNLIDSQITEVQTIVNELCAYIRSPFDLVYRRHDLEYSQKLEDMEDKSKLLAEQTVRRTIFEVISRQIDKYCKSENISYPANPQLSKIWEEVDLDFSYAHIFYSLDNLTLRNIKFNYSLFFGTANFNHSTFKGKTYFQGAKFYNDVSFEKTTFEGDVDFSSADFQKPHSGQVDSLASMIKSSREHPLGVRAANRLYKHLREKIFATPNKTVFYESKFYGAANFQCTLFYGWVDFQDAEFHEDVEFLSFVYEGMQFEQTRFNYKKKAAFLFLPKDKRQNMLKPQKYIDIETEKLMPIESIFFDPDSEENK